ncbi:signal peptidase I [bacterium]|nr:signal peptidase I [bacterium]MCI0680394.1 signal peptidase I [bacterium]
MHEDKEEGFEEKTTARGLIWETIKFAVVAALIVIPVRTLIAQPFIVSGDSMKPTFESADYLIVDQISYRFIEPERGDVIVFRYPRDPGTFFIKRIVGLPNETIEVREGKVFITENETSIHEITEPYIQYQSSDSSKMTLGEGEYFVMGDNRSASSDSRVWGPLPKKNITGRALLRLFPIDAVALFPGDYEIIF